MNWLAARPFWIQFESRKAPDHLVSTWLPAFANTANILDVLIMAWHQSAALTYWFTEHLFWISWILFDNRKVANHLASTWWHVLTVIFNNFKENRLAIIIKAWWDIVAGVTARVVHATFLQLSLQPSQYDGTGLQQTGTQHATFLQSFLQPQSQYGGTGHFLAVIFTSIITAWWDVAVGFRARFNVACHFLAVVLTSIIVVWWDRVARAAANRHAAWNFNFLLLWCFSPQQLGICDIFTSSSPPRPQLRAQECEEFPFSWEGQFNVQD